MELIETLKDLVKINTIKDKENESIINYLEQTLLKLGFKTEKKAKYLIMSIGNAPKLGFIGHTDTVEYIDGWDNSPFELTQKENKLYGLGSCDMKGGIACFLKALSEIDLKKLKYGIKCYFTYDEELTFKGIKEIINSKERMPEYTIIGEPTDNIPVTGCKGLLEIKINTKGIKVHSSNPDKGKSANSNMIKLLYELEEFYKTEIREDEDKIYEVPYTTMNIGLLNGGSATNSVSAECMSYMDFRTIKESHMNKIREKVSELCKKYDAEFKVVEEIKPFYNKINFIKKIHTAGYMTEASFFEGNRIILGVGPMTAHEVNEHVSIESLEKTVEQYKDIINNVCM